MDRLELNGVSEDGENKTIRARVIDDMVLVDSEGRGDSGVLLNQSEANLFGIFLQKVGASDTN